jgi:23S rRNA pseudouridine1911/1915/1917 synthase
MSDINHKIVGDSKYKSDIDPINRLALHAVELEFYHPILNKKIKLISEVPSSFIKLFNV